MLEEFRRLALFTSGVAELTRNRAEQLVRELVQSGEVRRDQASSLVKTVLDLGNENRREIGNMIRSEIRNQISSLGLATQRDLARLDRRVARIEDRQKEAARTSSSGAAARKRPKTTAASKKTTVRKKTSTNKTDAPRTSTTRAIDSRSSSGAGRTPGPADPPRP